MEYKKQISKYVNLSVSDIIEISKLRLPEQYKKHPWELVSPGVNPLQTEHELCAYMVAYGEMHWAKCRAAFQNFPFQSLNANFEIIDWGCGQGVASVTIIEMLREREKLNLLRKITLIEPSKAALNRAFANVDKATNYNTTVLTLHKYLPYKNVDTEIQSIAYEYPIVIHLFSNILDIQTINLEYLAKIVGSIGPKHYIMCMGPKNSGSYRIDQFCSIFNVSDLISNIDNSKYRYTSETHYLYSCKTKCFLFDNGKLSTQNINQFVAPTLIGDTPIYDDYDSRILKLNNVVTEDIYSINALLGNILSEQDSIYIKPNINGDTPDIVVVRPNIGILIINICEGSSEEDVSKAANTIQKYQRNLIQLHLKDLIGNSSNWSIFKMMLYCPSLSSNEARGICKTYKYVNLFGKDLFAKYSKSLLQELNFERTNGYFDKILCNRFINIISPKWHSFKQGEIVILTQTQEALSKSSENSKRKINGAAGAGKTQVLATRAVKAHIRTGKPVLILTYNLTLVNYIRYRVGKIREDFSWENIIINNYHQFFKTVANNHKERIELKSFEDEKFFDSIKQQLTKYSAIFIDEVQDYKTEWLRILHQYFLEENGEFVVFGDAKQNIYNRPLDENGLIKLDFIRGGWNNTLTRSMRFANTQLANMAMAFQKAFFVDQPNDTIEIQPAISFDTCIKYWNINPTTNIETISSYCRGIMQEYKLQTKDVVILSQYCDTLRELDFSYRQQTHLETATTHETKEQYDNLKKKHHITDDNPKVNFKFTNDIKQIRRNKRLHFTMDTNCIKMSTIHSYKGWDAKAVILILTPTNGMSETIEEHFEDLENEQSLIYIAITRAKEKLFILNIGNSKYDSFFQFYK